MATEFFRKHHFFLFLIFVIFATFFLPVVFADWCTERGYGGSCSILSSVNTKCIGVNPMECNYISSGHYCYEKSDTCNSSQACFDPFGPTPAQCMDLKCYRGNVYYFKENGSRSNLKETCSSNEVCSNGACVQKICAPNTNWCKSEAVMATCSRDGTSITDSSQNGKYCYQPSLIVPSASWVSCLSNSHCQNGYVCDSALKICVQDCSPSNYSYKCDSSTGDVYYYNKCNNKTSLKQDCTSSQVCKTNACVNKICTPGSKRCASETVIETCSSDGTVYNSEPVAYCLSISGSAQVVECLRDSHCSSDKQCTNNSCVLRPCTLNSVSWSKPNAVQWDSVQMTANTLNCNGKQVTFSLWENDGLLLDDKIADFTAVVSNNTAKFDWTAAFIEDQSGGPEYYFEAKIDSLAKTSSNLQVSASTTNTEFVNLNSLISSGPWIIVTYENPAGESLNFINSLKSSIESKSGSTVKIISQSSVSGCFDYANLSKNLVLVGDDNSNKSIDCLKSDLSNRAIKEAEVQLELEQNPWATGKYAIIVQGSDSYFEGLAALDIMVKKGTDPSWKFSDSVVGCLWTGDLSLGGEIVCNIIPIVELAPDVRDTYDCVKNKFLSLVKKEQTTRTGMINELFCGVVYGGTAYDIVSNVALIGGLFTYGITAVGSGVMELGDTSLATFKVFYKSVLNNFDTATLSKVYKTYKKMPASSQAIVLAAKNLPQMNTGSIKAVVNLLAEGEVVAEKGLKLLNKCEASFSKMDPTKVVESVTSIFKVESLKGIKVNVVASEAFVETAIKMGLDGKFFEKVETVTTALGAGSKIKELKFVDTIQVDAKALGHTSDAGVIEIAVGHPKFVSKADYAEMLLHNTLPHEIGHASFLGKITHASKADLATEEYLIDKTLRSKLVGTDKAKYMQFEEQILETNDYYSAIKADYDDGMTEAAQMYAEATDYVNDGAKNSINFDISKYFDEAYVAAHGIIPLFEQRTKMWAKFIEQSNNIRSGADNFISTGIWSTVTLVPLSAVLAAAETGPPVCTSFTYSPWGTCSNGTQSRTVVSSLPTGCTGGTPVLSQSCSVTCTGFTYSAWSACNNGLQSRTIVSATPAGCIGGNPVLSQSCVSQQCSPGEACCTASGTFKSLGTICQSNVSTEKRCNENYVEQRTANKICTGNSGTCSENISWSLWTAIQYCGSNQICADGQCISSDAAVNFRTSSLSYDSGSAVAFANSCGGDLTAFGQTNGACTEYSCSTSAPDIEFPYTGNNVTKAWIRNQEDICICNGSAAPKRYSINDSDASKVSTTKISTDPLMELNCSTCTSFTYSAWGTCNNGTQSRTVVSSLPLGCTGGNPVLTQSCSSQQCNPIDSCCNAAGTFKSVGTICQSNASVEQRCNGNTVEQRTATRVCSGNSGSCNGSLAWGNWSVIEQCTGTQACINNSCVVPGSAVFFRTTSISYGSGSAVAFANSCGGDLTAFGQTNGACTEFNCNTGSPQFEVPYSGNSKTKAWARSNGEDICICNGLTPPKRYSINDSDASKVSTTKTPIDSELELTC